MSIGPHSRGWSASLAAPVIGDTASEAYQHQQDHQRDIGERVAVEHLMSDSTTTDGQHLVGSARSGAGADSNQPVDRTTTSQDGPADGSTGGNELGRLYRITSGTGVGQLQFSDGSTWIEAIEALAGDGSNELDLIGGLQFLKAGADAMDIHAHASRHEPDSTDDPLDLKTYTYFSATPLDTDLDNGTTIDVFSDTTGAAVPASGNFDIFVTGQISVMPDGNTSVEGIQVMIAQDIDDGGFSEVAKSVSKVFHFSSHGTPTAAITLYVQWAVIGATNGSTYKYKLQAFHTADGGANATINATTNSDPIGGTSSLLVRMTPQ